MAVRYVGKVRYASIFAKKYGAPFCNGTGTVRCVNLKSQTFRALRRLFERRGKRQLKPTLNVWIQIADLQASDFKVS